MHAVPQIVLGDRGMQGPLCEVEVRLKIVESFEFSYFRQHMKAPSSDRQRNQ